MLCRTNGFGSTLTEAKESFKESTSRFEMNTVAFPCDKRDVLFVPNVRTNIESGRGSNIVQLTQGAKPTASLEHPLNLR